MSDADPIIPTPYIPPSNMQDYWQETVGPLYHPVKWNPRWATHPIRVREVMKKLKAGERCPEACDVIVGLIHSMCLSENLQRELGNIVVELTEAKDAQVPEQQAAASPKPPPSNRDLWTACNIIESAHEPDDLATAQAALDRWGMTYEEGVDELTRRGVVKRRVDSQCRPTV